MCLPGPIAHRSRLRLWSDQVVERIAFAGTHSLGRDRFGRVIATLLACAYMTPPFMAMSFALWASFGHWHWWMLAVAIVFLPISRAIRPLYRGQLILPLDAKAYALIQKMAEPGWMDTLAGWAQDNPEFDTRHLDACQEAFKRGRRGHIKQFSQIDPFLGHNALDLFEGHIGRLCQARAQALALQQHTTPSPDRHEGRRL